MRYINKGRHGVEYHFVLKYFAFTLKERRGGYAFIVECKSWRLGIVYIIGRGSLYYILQSAHVDRTGKSFAYKYKYIYIYIYLVGKKTIYLGFNAYLDDDKHHTSIPTIDKHQIKSIFFLYTVP
jgi:hypothetical protein